LFVSLTICAPGPVCQPRRRAPCAPPGFGRWGRAVEGGGDELDGSLNPTFSDTFKVALIGGTSHAGKSTTARAVAARLGGEAISTDSLARHPGRPWPTPTWVVPDHVAEHYATLTPEALIDSVLTHYRGMWPKVRGIIETRASDPHSAPLVLEGSALWPELVATLDMPAVRSVWLTADDALFTARIRRESRFDDADAAGRQLIDSFAARSRLYNAMMMAHIRRLGLACVEVSAAMSEDDVTGAVLAALGVYPHPQGEGLASG
jgi:2-phosphoglycerate kinase